MQRALLPGRTWTGRKLIAARRAEVNIVLRASVACWALAIGQAPIALAAFGSFNGTLIVQTSQIPPKFTNLANGAPISDTAQTPFPNSTELAVASYAGTTKGDGVYDFGASASSTIGPPFGMGATSSVTFTQSVTTTGPRWMQLVSRVGLQAPEGQTGMATASISLARFGQAATFTINSDTGGLDAARQGVFTAGTFTVGGVINTSASSVIGVRSGVLDGYFINAAIADFNGSGSVTQTDLGTWKTGFGSLAGTFASGNLDGDGDTDGVDFLIWQRQLGATVPTTTAAGAVPEPASIAMLVIALAALSRGRR